MSGDNAGNVVRIYGFPDYCPRVRDVQRVVAGGDDHHRDVPGRWTGLELPKDSPPVHLGEQEVENNEIGQVFVDEAQRRQTITGPHHGKAVHLQRHAVHLRQRRVVFNNQDPWAYDQGGKLTAVIPS